MTIDERLDKLTERHEALTQSVEMLVMSQHKNEATIESLVSRIESLVSSQRKNETLLAQVIGSISQLANIAHLHEQRITGLENPQ